MPDDMFQGLDADSPKTKADYLVISRQRGLPPRCPLLKRCERRKRSLELFSEMEGSRVPGPELEEPVISALTSPSAVGTARSSSFSIKDLCPEVPLYDTDHVFGGLGGHPIISVSYDKYFEGDEKCIVTETGHYSDCGEYGTVSASPMNDETLNGVNDGKPAQEALSRRVFIVHGHEGEPKQRGGSVCLNSFPGFLSGASAGVRPPREATAG